MVSVAHSLKVLVEDQSSLNGFYSHLGQGLDDTAHTLLMQAHDFVAMLYGTHKMDTGERMIDHARGTVVILSELRTDVETRLAALLFAIPQFLSEPTELIEGKFGGNIAQLVAHLVNILRMQELAHYHANRSKQDIDHSQAEVLRKMLLAMASDIRVVFIRLASRLQTLRFFAHSKLPGAELYARETTLIYAPLANRLGIWQTKWELEDLAFRFNEPVIYKSIAKALDEKRSERESFIKQAIEQLQQALDAAHIQADVSGRPKHIFSIHKKMCNKKLDFNEIYDVRAFRVIVEDVANCYAVLGIVHDLWQRIDDEFDDYIAKPKANGYQSLHTILISADGKPFEVQIRTKAMHRFAEYGVAAHWRYKEVEMGQQSFATAEYDEKIAMVRRLLEWRNEVAEHQPPELVFDDHIYVLTPQAEIIELPTGSTAIDYAYHIHTNLGHRCRGVKLDGVIAPLNAPLKTGQTVEIITTKQGAPSRDWLNPQLGYIKSARARAKIRQFFNTIDLDNTISAGRAVIERELARLGKSATNLDELAQKLNCNKAEDLFIAATRQDFSLRTVEAALNGSVNEVRDELTEADLIRRSKQSQNPAQGNVLVVGVDQLLTHLSKCCKPAPPDHIAGFVTKGKGISIHRHDCKHFQAMVYKNPERLIETTWGNVQDMVYAIDIMVIAQDRQGLLRDISEVLSKEKMNVIGVHTVSQKSHAKMQFTVEIKQTQQVDSAMYAIRQVSGVLEVRRK
jgi:GTP pyrophosphokinase